MGREYKELECGCMVSEEGGGGLIPCEASGLRDLVKTEHDPKSVELHNKCIEDFKKRKSYFPILIELVESKEKKVFKSPKDLPSGVAFKILETSYNG